MVTAVWREGAQQYIACGADHEWYSDDGDNWCDTSGEPVDTKAFRESRITLVGGPRDGEVVS